nr:MAG TPA: hypothetical protein [Myoviridae sp. ct6nn14]
MNLLCEYAMLCRGGGCKECPLNTRDGRLDFIPAHPDEAERIIRERAEAHPEQTYKSYFLERFPNARMGLEGISAPCVGVVYGDAHKPKTCPTMPCADCWNRPYKEDV